MKKYNLFCLKCNSSQPNALEITEHLNEVPFTRGDVFYHLFCTLFPDLSHYFEKDFLVSVDRGFFSPFNRCSEYKTYAFRLGYLKKQFSFLVDKTIVSRVLIHGDFADYDFIFFVKEVCDE